MIKNLEKLIKLSVLLFKNNDNDLTRDSLIRVTRH